MSLGRFHQQLWKHVVLYPSRTLKPRVGLLKIRFRGLFAVPLSYSEEYAEWRDDDLLSRRLKALRWSNVVNIYYWEKKSKVFIGRSDYLLSRFAYTSSLAYCDKHLHTFHQMRGEILSCSFNHSIPISCKFFPNRRSYSHRCFVQLYISRMKKSDRSDCSPN